MPKRRLYRSKEQRLLLGVCGGIAEYFDVDPTIVRVLFVIAALAAGPGILAYLIMAIVIPPRPALPPGEGDRQQLSG